MIKFLLTILLLSSIQCSYAQFKFNGNFETVDVNSGKPVGWLLSFNPTQEKAYPVQLDSIIKQQGKFSISVEKISNDAEFGVIDFPVYKIFEGSEVTLKGYIKTKGVKSGYAGLWMRFDDAQGKSFAFDNMQDRGLKGDNDWKLVSITLPYNGEKVIAMHFGGLLVGDGKAWFDQFEVFINGKALNQVKFKERILKKADTDTSFAVSSGIKKIDLNKQQIINLKTAGQFWAFLKYHHPNIASGEYNWDAELFRLLPEVIKSSNNNMLSNALETFLDKLPKPEICKGCGKTSKNKNEINPNYDSLIDGSVLTNSLIQKLGYIKKNNNIKTSYYVGFAGAGNPEFKNERAYPAMAYPDLGYRILSLYRYWGMINYFFPYRDVIGEDWNAVLSTSITDFVDAKNDLDYSLAALKLIARIKDTHANIYGYNKALEDFKGKYAVPFQAKFIENKLVITALHTDTLDVKDRLKVGDIIDKINGISVQDLVKKYLPITAASNYDTQLRNISRDFLLRSNLDKLKLSIQSSGKNFEYEAPMGKLILAYKDDLFDKAVAYKIMDNNIGYVFPGKYKNEMLPDIKEKFKGVNGIIIDMRCYPSDFMPFKFGNYLKAEKSPFVKFTLGSLTSPGSFAFFAPIENGGVKGENHFKGKVVVIVNSTTQSQAEYTTMAFQSSSNVRVIGSTTAGADGNVSPIILPGGIYTMISGIGVFYPDGTPSQRVGVKIDYPIYPTIKGVKSGRDELLEKAVNILSNGW